jgi:hypothetical protein
MRRQDVPPLQLPAPPRRVTDEEREATMRAQVLASAASKVVASAQPALAEQRRVCQLALQARPAPPSALELGAKGTPAELAAAIRGHRRYASSGTLSLLGKSREQLACILASLEPRRGGGKELHATSSERFLRTARLAERAAEVERLKARAAAAAARTAALAAAAAEKAALAARPRHAWERGGGGGGKGGGGGGSDGEDGAPRVREKTEEEKRLAKEAHVRSYWKLTNEEALSLARSKYASHSY